MASETNPSFSARQRWAIFFSVLISIVAAIALVAMLNYLGAKYFMRFAWSAQAKKQLSQQTIGLLKAITNDVSVVIYFDKTDNLYSEVSSMLNEYHLNNPRISVASVDYQVDATAAQQVKATNRLGSGEDKNLVIFNSAGHRFIVPTGQLAAIRYQAVPDSTNNEYEKHIESYDDEKQFSAALLNVTNPKVRKAYFLAGHGEHDLDSAKGDGYKSFGLVLEENNVEIEVIRLFGTNNIPADCSLLIIAGPRARIPADELEKIRVYLNRGGHLFALFNYATVERHIDTGLEGLLAEWNIAVGQNVVTDHDNDSQGVTMVNRFNHYQPIVTPLIGYTLALVNPRTIDLVMDSKQGPEAPKVEKLAFTGTNAVRTDQPLVAGASYSLMVAASKATAKGARQEGGSTGIVAVGDSTFLDNLVIEAVNNRDFAGFALNWLLDQTQLMEGIGPHPVKEYKLMMTTAQLGSLKWIFLAAMPGAILFAGGLVWFRRRR